jgi:hyaluronan synthase
MSQFDKKSVSSLSVDLDVIPEEESPGDVSLSNLTYQPHNQLNLPQIAQDYTERFDRNNDKNYGILVVGYREDPHYFKICLQKIKAIAEQDSSCSHIFIIIDGNESDDQYMADMTQDIFHNRILFLTTPFYDLSHEQRMLYFDQIHSEKIICITQPQRGKRHAMYPGLWLSQKFEIPYIMVTDSDTWIELNAPYYLKTLLEQNPTVGATTGNVKIYNVQNLLSLYIDMKYWFAFNLERAAQSYFHCVSCVSGPLGMYRVSAIAPVLEKWITQSVCGRPTTFGDDRHMTNLLLGQGFQVLYTHKAVCYTETPHTLSRWFTQQTRWGRSFFREYLLGITSFYKVSWWLVYDLTYLTFYSLFLFIFSILMLMNLSIHNLLSLITTAIIVASIRALYAIVLEKDWKYALFAHFGIIYFICLLPLKIWSALSFFINDWGTSNRKALSTRFFELWPVVIWSIFLIYCITQSCINFIQDPLFDTSFWIYISVLSVSGVGWLGLWIYLVKSSRNIYGTQVLLE